MYTFAYGRKKLPLLRSESMCTEVLPYLTNPLQFPLGRDRIAGMRTKLEVGLEILRLYELKTLSSSLENIAIEAQIRALTWVLSQG